MVLAWGALVWGWGVYGLGFAFGRYGEARAHRSPTWARMVHSAALVLAALVWWRGRAVGTELAGYAAMVFYGMLSSFVGDLLMARVVPLPKYPIPGMVAFGTAHILYILGYVQAGAALGLGDGLAWGIGVGGGLILAAVLWWLLIRAPEIDPILGYGALGYALLLGGMAGAAAGLAFQQPRFTVLSVGALLFLASDAILGNRLFRRNEWFLVGDVVWLLYTAGQSLIIFTLPVVV